VVRSIAFYRTQAHFPDLPKLYLSGGTARFPSIGKRLGEALGVAVEILDPFGGMGSTRAGTTPPSGPQYAQAFGLALRAHERPVFTINFRRDVRARDGRSRHRVIMLASWGLFRCWRSRMWSHILNAQGMQKRIRDERQTAQFVAARICRAKCRSTTARCGDRAVPRQPAALPRQAGATLRLDPRPPSSSRWGSILRLESVHRSDKFVITGSLRATAADDPMRGVVQLVAVLQADSAFSAGYKSIKLSQSHADATAKGITEFTIECR
jgi:hypothetical protein